MEPVDEDAPTQVVVLQDYFQYLPDEVACLIFGFFPILEAYPTLSQVRLSPSHPSFVLYNLTVLVIVSNYICENAKFLNCTA